MRRNFKTFINEYFVFPKNFVFTFSLLIFFWAIFDSIMSYLTPLLIEENGFSKSMVGLIIGSSSITGALFDFVICRIFKNTDFRRVFLTMFAICLIYPLLLWQSKTLWLFLLAMAIWGIYYDLHGFGIFDFIGRHTEKKDHSSNFGIIQIFQSLGVILAPLIVGFVIVDAIDWRAFSLGWIFLIVSFTFFLTLLIFMRKHRPTDGNLAYPPRRKNFFTELHLWKKLGKLLTPVLLLTFYLFFIDAFFWTLAPLYAEASSLGEFGGLFLTAYALPALIVGWFVGSLTKRFGKKERPSSDYC